MMLRATRSKRTDTLFPYATLFRSQQFRRLGVRFLVVHRKRLERRQRPVRVMAFFDQETVEAHAGLRSEEHTSELQSLMRISYAVFCLKKIKIADAGIKTTIKGSNVRNPDEEVHSYVYGDMDK